MKYTYILLFILLSNLIFSQTSDDFADGNFNENPEWKGTTEFFKVNTNFQLQLNGTEEGISYLSTINSMIDLTEWRCWIKLSFSPSGNNNARYYLVSSNENLLDPLNGYFLQFGEPGSNDAIELFRQDGNEIISVCRGTDGILSSSFEIRVKITREDGGRWKLYVDQLGGEDFNFEAEGVDNTYSQTSFLGYFCKYTSSNSSKMYFDDIYAGPLIIDNEPPVLLSISSNTDSTTTLQFNEILSEESAAVTNNYKVDNGIGPPTIAYRDEIDASIIRLVFNSKFELGINYNMSVSGVKDLAENIMNPQELEFSYYQPQPYDIVINEIMADPTPVVGLPEFEYIELYNQTETIIDLNEWTLLVGTSEKKFEDITLEAGSYLILAKISAESELGLYGNFYGFSSFSLTNSGQTVELISNHGATISKVSYSDGWYNDPNKEDGGWSIEQKNASNFCSGSENWAASNDNKGGTPGSINSVHNNVILLPQLSSLEIYSDNIIQLYFNQNMNEESLNNSNAYLVNEGVGIPTYVYTYYDEPNKVELYFDKEFNQGTKYELTISKSIMNCMGIQLTNDTIVVFGLPDIAEYNDIIINEILFNPWTGGEDYVELYNSSEKVLDLSTLQIGSIKESPPNPPDTTIVGIIDNQLMLLPGEYLLLTVSPVSVLNQYTTTNPDVFIKVDPFPSYNNDKGKVLLISYDAVVIDTFSYFENMQFPLLIYTDGVALERINPDVTTSDNNNWHSAAEAVGFGTPGLVNSQYVSNINTKDEIIIEPEIFSPDNDGYDDVLNIKYKFDSPGYMMSVTVFNAEGYQVRELTNNEYLGIDGTVSWDGIQDDNSKAPIGIYVFYISVFDIEGNVKKYKKTGVLATKL